MFRQTFINFQALSPLGKYSCNLLSLMWDAMHDRLGGLVFENVHLLFNIFMFYLIYTATTFKTIRNIDVYAYLYVYLYMSNLVL